MKILLDTHVLIWCLSNDPRLSEDARRIILTHENIIYFSVASLWEITIKNQKAPKLCPYHEATIMRYCKLSRYEFLPIMPDHVLSIRGLRIKEGHFLANKDPFDRILLAQAKEEQMVLLTHDQVLSHYDEPCIRFI